MGRPKVTLRAHFESFKERGDLSTFMRGLQEALVESQCAREFGVDKIKVNLEKPEQWGEVIERIYSKLSARFEFARERNDASNKLKNEATVRAAKIEKRQKKVSVVGEVTLLTKQTFRRLKEDGNYSSDGALLEALVESYLKKTKERAEEEKTEKSIREKLRREEDKKQSAKLANLMKMSNEIAYHRYCCSPDVDLEALTEEERLKLKKDAIRLYRKVRGWKPNESLTNVFSIGLEEDRVYGLATRKLARETFADKKAKHRYYTDVAQNLFGFIKGVAGDDFDTDEFWTWFVANQPEVLGKK